MNTSSYESSSSQAADLSSTSCESSDSDYENKYVLKKEAKKRQYLKRKSSSCQIKQSATSTSLHSLAKFEPKKSKQETHVEYAISSDNFQIDHLSLEKNETDFDNLSEDHEQNCPDYSDSSSDLPSSNEDDDYEIDDLDKPIFRGSRIFLGDFIFIFSWVCIQLRLDQVKKAVLLRFIKILLPSDNIIPGSVYKLQKYESHKTFEDKLFDICNICCRVLESGEFCRCKLDSRRIKVAKFDIKKQLCSMISKHWTDILAYKGKLIFLN
jgi:hypothetical protein